MAVHSLRSGCFAIVLIFGIVTILAIAPLAYPGFFQTHSGFLPAFNTAHPADAPNWGRLADLVRGEGKLPYLLTWPFFKLSGSGVTAVKWGYGLAFLLGALGTYLWARRWLGVRGGLLAAVVYTTLPWHLSTVYVRGAYAEAWLWAWWPFILWAVDRLAHGGPGPRWARVAVGLLALGGTLWTQLGLAVVFFLGIMLAVNLWIWTRRWERIAWILIVLLFIAVGFLAQRPQARVPFADQFLYPFQLLSAGSRADGLSFQLGLAAVGLSTVAVVLKVAMGRHDLKTEERKEGEEAEAAFGRAFWSWVVVLAAIMLLTMPLTAPIWKAIGLDELVTTPWQLLALAGLPLAFLAGSIIRLDRRLGELPAWAGLTALVLLASTPALAPRFTRVDPGPEPVALFRPVGTGATSAGITLLEADIQSPTEITPTLTLTLTWQVTEPVTDDYTVFVHLLDASGDKVAQRDARPCSGDCPTNAWQPGQIVVDRHSLDLAALPGPAGPYRLALGLYLLDGGERAAVVGRDDQMVLIDVP